MLQAGKLDRRIVLVQLTQGQDVHGGMTRSWTDLASVAASIRNFPGTEREQTAAGGGQAAVARTEFTIRYRPEVTVAMRVRYGGALYNIRHVDDRLGRHEMLVLTCDSGVPNA